jgi:hypothetical protein
MRGLTTMVIKNEDWTLDLSDVHNRDLVSLKNEQLYIVVDFNKKIMHTKRGKVLKGDGVYLLPIDSISKEFLRDYFKSEFVNFVKDEIGDGQDRHQLHRERMSVIDNIRYAINNRDDDSDEYKVKNPEFFFEEIVDDYNYYEFLILYMFKNGKDNLVRHMVNKADDFQFVFEKDELDSYVEKIEKVVKTSPFLDMDAEDFGLSPNSSNAQISKIINLYKKINPDKEIDEDFFSNYLRDLRDSMLGEE